MELGTAAHKLVLGKGAELVVIEAENYRGKAAQECAKDARAAGKVPLLPHEHEQVQAMAAAIREHPVAGALFDPEHGDPEQSLFWQDAEFGIWRRARLDWLPRPAGYGRRMVVPDLKSCTSAAPAAIAKAVANLGYYVQAAWYVDAVEALGLADDPAFLLVFVETAPPYLITVAQLDEEAMAIGRRRGAEACERFRDCTECGIWPGYELPGYAPGEIIPVSLPYWATRELEFS